MELKEYIKTTLVQITEGVLESKKVLTKRGVLINPPVDYGGKTVRKGGEEQFRAVQYVEFQVAISGATKLDGTVSGKLNVYFTSSEVKGNMEKSDSKTNNLRFSIPISLPFDEK